MRLSALPLVLAGLLGSAALAPEAAQAYPYGDQRYSDQRYAYGGQRYAYDNYGPPRGRTYAPLPVSPYGYPIASEPELYSPPPVNRCNRGTVLTGAAIGGGLGAMLASNSRNRLWSLPMGAAMGGILGGVISGC
jgi:hypothetical protein